MFRMWFVYSSLLRYTVYIQWIYSSYTVYIQLRYMRGRGPPKDPLRMYGGDIQVIYSVYTVDIQLIYYGYTPGILPIYIRYTHRLVYRSVR
jgi:hypothetical protein